MARGQLILIEGLDRTGKTTQSELLLSKLKPNAKLMKFPNRDTPIGQLINKYLTEPDYELPDQTIHLLFCANRWECMNDIIKLLNDGTNVILDRYVLSGVAYSAAKKTPGMDLNWCLQPDKGLLKPDLTIFLVNNDHAGRDGFGDERYEKTDFQARVKLEFEQIIDTLKNTTNISVMDVSDQSISEVQQRINVQVDKILSNPNENCTYF